MEKELKLNAEEAQVLLNLVDIAVKAAGLQAAEAGVHFGKKLTVVLNEFKAAETKEDSPKKAITTAIEDAVEVK